MLIVAEFENELRRRSKAFYGQWHTVDLHNHSPVSHDFKGDRKIALLGKYELLYESDRD